MIRRGPAVAGLALAVSVALHAGGLVVLAPDPPAALAGGPPQLAMIGNSFEDAAAGRLAPSEVRAEVAPVAVPEVTPVPTPEATATPARSPMTETVRPQDAPRATPAPPSRIEASPVTAPIPPGPSILVPTTPAAPAPQAATAPPERIAARDRPEPQTPDADTPRPQPRGARPVQTAEVPRPPPPAPSGSAAQDSRAGQTGGAQQGNAVQAAQGGAAQSASDGRAVAAYPQLVNRHLGRLSRPNARFNGATVIAFSIAPGGGLAAVQVAQSSGNAEFDRIALAHVQRAAPFPPPPPGAQRSFNVTVRGR